MKSKQALCGETHSLTVANNTVKSDEKCWRFLREVFPYSSHPQPTLLLSLLSVTMKHKERNMKSKKALRGQIYSFIVAYNTAKSGGGFDKKYLHIHRQPCTFIYFVGCVYWEGLPCL